MTDPRTATDAWASNADAHRVAELLADARTVLILTHAKPDGDAIGSTTALARALAARNTNATCVHSGPWPERFDTLIDAVDIRRPERDDIHALAADADAIAILDTGSWSQLADVAPALNGHAAKCVIVDHHGHGNPEIADHRWIDTSAAAACEMVAALAAHLLDRPSPAALPPTVATPLYLGIATDTGWFRFSNVTAHTHRLAADLIDAGADADALYQLSEQSDTLARLELVRRALATLRIAMDRTVAVMTLTRDDFDAAGATLDDTGGIVDIPRTVADIRVCALAIEYEPGLTKLSLRSRSGPGAIDVNRVAQELNGGGHTHAAGARLDLPADQAVDALLDAIARATP